MTHTWNTITTDQYVETSADLLRRSIEQACREHGHCVLGLSGGSTPRAIYQALGRRDLPWRQLEVFLIDDRYVPADHPDSNTALVRHTLLAACTAEWLTAHFHAPNTALSYERCVAEYGSGLERLLAEFGGPHVITLGMGDDGHIASLFPPVLALAAGPEFAVGTATDRYAVRERISVTLPVLQQSEQAFMLLKGAAKKHVWEEMLASTEGVERWPAKGVRGPLTVLYAD